MGNHLIVMHSAVRALPGYSRHEAPSIFMEGTSVDRESEHGRAVTSQLRRDHATLSEAIESGGFALAAAHLPKGVRRQARAACEDYFYSRLGLTPEQPLDHRAKSPNEGLEPMPEAMYLALEDVIELIVDGEYDDLNELSGDRLDVEDLRRRVEDECPAALVLPPREHYIVEAISKTDESGETGWAYFLDLWEEGGAARLHIEGELEKSGERFRTTLDDILP
jgi:hypothetical protein